MSAAIAGAEVYDYDELGRLKTVTQPDGSRITYDLDAAGNRKARTTIPSSGVLQFATSAETRDEGAGAIAVTISRSFSTDGAVGVTLGVVGGTATQGVDYTISPTGPISFAAGIASATVTITILEDANYEAPDETVQLMLSGETGGAVLGNNETYTLTIANNDPPPDTTPPGLPGVPTFTNITHESVTASWTAATDNIAVTGYDYRVNGGAWQGVGNVLNANITGLTASTTYTVQVRARDAQGNTTVTPSSNSFTTAPPPDTTPPSVPTNMAATARSTTSVEVTWIPSTDTGSGVLLYSIERCTGAGCSDFTAVGTAYHDRPGENPPPHHSYMDTNVSGYTTYRYRIRARDGAGNYSAYTAIDDTTTPDLLAPIQPSGLAASSSSLTSVDLTWSASSDTGGSGLAGYRIERCTGTGCSSYAEVGTSTTTSYTDGTVSGGITYRYRVRAIDGANNFSPYSNEATIVTSDTIAPSVPANLTANAPNSSQVELSWGASTDTGGAGVATYLIERCTGSGCSNFAQVSTVPASAWPGYLDPAVDGATAYSYRVRARDGSNNTSGPSNVASVTTPPRNPPSIPTNFQAIAMDTNRVGVQWQPPTSDGDGSEIGLYSIERCVVSGGSCTFSSLAGVLPNTGDPPPPGHTYIDTSVSGWTTYRYRMRARNGSGTYSAYTAEKETTTPDGIAPLPPTNFAGSAAGSTRVSLTWTAGSDSGGSGLASYRIERCAGSGCGGFAEINSTASTSYNDDTVTGTTAYRYRIRARDGAGNNSTYTNPVDVTTTDSIAPTTPSGLTASVATGPLRVNLSWGASSDSGGSGLAGYRIYRGGSHIATTTATSYSDTSVASGTTYSYTVAAYDNANNPSLQSNTASATTPSVPTATLNHNVWNWHRQVNGSGTTTTVTPSPTIIVTATGGSGGYMYQWEWVSGDTQTSVVSPTSSSTKWSRSVTAYFQPYVSTWRCRVTDSAGAVTYTPNVTVTFLMENES